MTNQKILLKQILREIIKDLILSPQTIRGGNTTHTSHLMHIDQRPASRKPRAIFPVQEHHPRNNTHVMLPPVTQLMPPFPLDDLALVDLVDGPEVAVGFVEEDGLEDVLVVGDGGFVGGMVHPELMLVVGTVEGHFDLLHVFGVGVRVVHWSVAGGFAVLAFLLVFGEGDLFFLLLVFGFGAEVGVEVGFIVVGKVFAIRVGDGYVVEEAGTPEDELLFPCCSLAEKLEGVVGQDTHDHVVECF